MKSIANPLNKGTKPRSKNATFAALEWTREMILPQGEKVLLYALASRIDEDYRAMFPREILMQDAGIKSRQSFAKHVESLSEKNLIRVGKHSHKGNKWPRNSYQLMVPPRYRVKKMDPVSDAQDLSSDAQNLSDDAQNMGPNYTYNYPYNYTVEDKQKDETCDSTEPQPKKFLQVDSGKSGKELQTIHPDTKKTKSFADDFPVAAKFNHHKLSNAAKVCHWWECLQQYRADQYHPQKKLTEHQSKKLWELYEMFSYKPIRALAIIEWTVRHWNAMTGADKKEPWDTGPPKHPTPTWIANNLEICSDYFQKTSPVKFKPH